MYKFGTVGEELTGFEYIYGRTTNNFAAILSNYLRLNDMHIKCCPYICCEGRISAIILLLTIAGNLGIECEIINPRLFLTEKPMNPLEWAEDELVEPSGF